MSERTGISREDLILLLTFHGWKKDRTDTYNKNNSKIVFCAPEDYLVFWINYADLEGHYAKFPMKDCELGEDYIIVHVLGEEWRIAL